MAAEFGAMHALVDAACAANVYAEAAAGRLPDRTLVSLVLFYNVLAFGSQWLIGLLADLRKSYRLTGAAGVSLIALGLFVEPLHPWGGVALSGIGNACFHVGAGALVLRSSRGRAAESGIFVAPGAVGVAAGIWLGLHEAHWRGLCAALLLFSGLRAARPRPGAPSPEPPRTEAAVGISQIAAPVLMLLASVAIRSTIGGALGGTWRAPAFAFAALAGAALAGKAMGGCAADRLGWRLVAVPSLLLAAPMVAAGFHGLGAALAGMAIFQVTMPVTLAAIYLAIPKQPGLAFGLPCLALLLGALPGMTGALSPGAAREFAVPLILLSAVLIRAGLGLGRSN
jgi:FSR family fosmidomycin resistance protein-like MFS transporter